MDQQGQPQTSNEPQPAGELLDETFRLYRKAFWPLVSTAGSGALVANLLLVVYAPANQAFLFLWTLFAFAISIATQSAVLLLAARAREGQPLTAATAVAAIAAFGPRYFAATFLVTFVAGLLFFTIVGIPLAAFIYIRCCLYGPAIVIEDQTIAGALVRSWRLVNGRWWRTLGLQLVIGVMAVAPFGIAYLILIPLQNTAAEVVLDTIASALAIPLVAVFSLLLFDDYRGLADRASAPKP